MRVLVCGSRSYEDRFPIHASLDALALGLPPGEKIIVINGFAAGVDRMADEWASDHETGQPWRFAADWATCTDACPPGHHRTNRAGAIYCPLAGIRRNQRMLDEGRPELVLAFTDKPLTRSKGTADMVRRARAAGITVVVHEPPRGPA